MSRRNLGPRDPNLGLVNGIQEVLVIGIDFGTTYSGAAWCLRSNPKHVQVVDKWPGLSPDAERASGQVPTVLEYYNENDSSKFRWGWEVNQDITKPLALFKLLLNQDDETLAGPDYVPRDAVEESLQNTISLIPKGKTLLDVVADYLRMLVKYTRKAVEKTQPPAFIEQLRNAIPIDFVITVPAVWSDKAKSAMLQASDKAGLASGNWSVRLISEPEAAAMHCFQYFKITTDCLKNDNIYVIADCGGGTVDLITYEITATQPCLEIKESVLGTGSLCGSTSVNSNFLRYLESLFEPNIWRNLNPARIHRMQKSFEYIKRCYVPSTIKYSNQLDFSDDSDDDERRGHNQDAFEPVSVDVPSGLEIPGRIENSQLLIEDEDMMALYQSSFDVIFELVVAQITQAERFTERKVTGVILVGGYGASPYLRSFLKKKLRRRLQREVMFLVSVDPWTAIVRGAVHEGLSRLIHGDSTNVMLKSRRARFSYGISMNAEYQEGVHPSSHRYYDKLEDKYMCRGLVDWFIKKNQELTCGQSITFNHYRLWEVGYSPEELIVTISVYVCDKDDPPMIKRSRKVHKLLDFTIDFTPFQDSFVGHKSAYDCKLYYLLEYTTELIHDSAQLKILVKIDGESAGASPTIDFYHHRPSTMPQKQHTSMRPHSIRRRELRHFARQHNADQMV